MARELGARIRSARRARNLTQGQLGDPLTKGYVSAVERGRTLPSVGALLLLADHLEIGVEELLRDVKERSTVGYTAAHGSATASRAGDPAGGAGTPPRDQGRRR